MRNWGFDMNIKKARYTQLTFRLQLRRQWNRKIQWSTSLDRIRVQWDAITISKHICIWTETKYRI